MAVVTRIEQISQGTLLKVCAQRLTWIGCPPKPPDSFFGLVNFAGRGILAIASEIFLKYPGQKWRDR